MPFCIPGEGKKLQMIKCLQMIKYPYRLLTGINSFNSHSIFVRCVTFPRLGKPKFPEIMRLVERGEIGTQSAYPSNFIHFTP